MMHPIFQHNAVVVMHPIYSQGTLHIPMCVEWLDCTSWNEKNENLANER